MAATVAILALHIYEHPRRLRAGALRSSLAKIGATGLSGMVVLSAVVAPGFLTPDAVSARVPRPFPLKASPARSLVLGVTTDALAKNSTRPWDAGALAQVNAFEQAARAHVGIVMWFADWEHARPNLSQLRAIARRGSVPEISWEPWNYAGNVHSQPRYTLASIIRGHHDPYIRAWARALRSYGAPVLLRLAQEMNGNWYPWSEAVNGNRPGQFVRAWRHIHDIFKATHVKNVKWVWSPAAGGLAIRRSQYPGAAYVDVVGLSVFNGGTALHWGGWRTFARIFETSFKVVHQIAPTKPVQISEVASAELGGNKATWITAMFSDLRRHPEVKSLIWYDLRKQTDWPITSSHRASLAFAAGAAGRTLAPRP